LSGVVGFHDFGFFGLDGTLLTSIPIRKDIRLFAGVDLDINFYSRTPSFLIWVPVGAEIGIHKNISLIGEFSIALTSPAYNLVGFGAKYYF
jgi:hypothetical protein